MIDSRELSQRAEIVDALLSYTRGIDRLDKESVISAFHPGATLNNYGSDPMPVSYTHLTLPTTPYV